MQVDEYCISSTNIKVERIFCLGQQRLPVFLNNYSHAVVVGGYNSRQILDIVFILRVLRLIRVVDSIQRFSSTSTPNNNGTYRCIAGKLRPQT